MTGAPVRIIHLDVAGDDLGLPSGGPVFVVLWWKTLALGALTLAAEELPCADERLRDLAAGFVANQLIARAPRFGPPPHAMSDGVPKQAVALEAACVALDLAADLDALAAPVATSAEDLSVVVCTRDRTDSLERCLASLQALDPPPGEILVVDNSASGTARPVCEAQAGISYVHEPRPGLSIARNAGVRAAGRPLIAFTDDDVQLHPGWAGALVGAFADSDVEAVTGLVLPASLDTAAQVAFEQDLGGFTHAFVPMRYDERFLAATVDVGPQVWRIGAGANMAFRREVFDRVGLFDERLGAGASGCSEDSEFWYRILAAGGACLYEPRAVVSHHHRAEWSEMLSQIRAYMQGHVSALVVQADRYGHRSNIARIFIQLPRHFVHTALEGLKHSRPGRLRILRNEVQGWAQGLRYVHDRAWRRRGEGAPHA